MSNPALNIMGLLWAEYDESKKLGQVIKEACVAHERRLGFAPNLVLVHPLSKLIKCNGIEVGPQHNILRFHYFVVNVGDGV
ncbi:unnamed protein product [marine sediment metagenome]|uniref:Uncharacterized protein n=1 Tax=marine sediment metagenome TaxID=412755 RepID=X0WYR6_9ZZZZ